MAQNYRFLARSPCCRMIGAVALSMKSRANVSSSIWQKNPPTSTDHHS